MKDVGVVYLYRFAEGESPVRRFLDTYRNHRAGVDHDFHVVFKGFPDRDSLARGSALFDGFPINAIEHDDVDFDIGSYRHAANLVLSRRLIFLNTFSQILADNWLAHFHRALDVPLVGVAGATGSWLASSAHLERAFKYLLDKMRGSRTNLPWRRQDSNADNAHSAEQQGQRPIFRYLFAPAEYLHKLYEYGRFPNPHIRTNAFMMERERFLSLNFWCFKSKNDAYKFESGRRSMTRQILQQRLTPIVVDRNGEVYCITEWKSSSTFWIGEQSNLIIADNRTADYADADRWRRQSLENLAWVRPWDWNNLNSPGRQ